MLPLRASSPHQLGPYTLVERLAQGGMAAIFKAKLTGPSGFEKTVVVKSMLPALTAHEELVQLFCAEARLSAQLQHPNIVQVLDFGVEDGTPYLVMEYLDGWTLAQLRDRLSAGRRSRFAVGAAVKVARDICLALGHAHNFVDADGQRLQIIHRDVSPSNVMLCRDGSVKLLDFGIARVATATGVDSTSSFRGKYAYMAPEQVHRKPIDRRVDVFAIGTVLHEMLTGKRLFASVSELETLERVAAAQVTAPSGENPEVPRALDAIVKKALSRDPLARYSSGTAMAEALDTLDDIFSRRRLAKLLRQVFPEAWTIVCEVCGKQVAPGHECGECGTIAPVDESSASDADFHPSLQPPAPLPPPPVLPRRAFSPPHLFVVPRLPSRALDDDDSVKMGVRPERAHVEIESASLPVSLGVPSPPVTLVPPPIMPLPPLLPLSPPAAGRGGRWAMLLLAVGVIGIGVTLWSSRATTATTPSPPLAVTAPAATPPAATAVVVTTPVIVVRRDEAAASGKITRTPRKRHRAAASSTVKDGRIVDPFAGGD